MGGCAWPANGAIRSSPYARCWHLCCSPSPGLCTASQASACLPPYPWAGALSATRSCSPTKGLSGPAILQASCFWRQGEALHIDFLPDHPALELMHQPEHGKSTVSGLFEKVLPTRLAERLIPGSLASRKVAQLAKKDREYLALAIHDHMVTPSRSEGMGHAEAAAGGVDTSDVNPRTLESRKQPGLYFAGEVLDVTGLLGGYNLHWAWASG